MNNLTMALRCSCPFCSEITEVRVAPSDYLRWQGGELARRAFNYLTAAQREALISGLCPNCQDSFFAEEAEG